MILRRSLINFILGLTILCLIVSPASASPMDGFGGSVSTKRIDQGSKVFFTGSIHNFLDNPILVVSMNITFMEVLGETSTRDPEFFNLSRYYDDDRRQVGVNHTLTDTFERLIDFEAGSYDVSIFFDYTNSTNVSPSTVFGQLYSMINETVLVIGTTQALEVARIIGFLLLGIFVLLVSNYLYNKFKN